MFMLHNVHNFLSSGEYAGFDEHQLTSRNGGKGSAVRELKEKYGYETVVMIGDGITGKNKNTDVSFEGTSHQAPGLQGIVLLFDLAEDLAQSMHYHR